MAEIATPEFKIIASGTHASQAAGGITMDPPPEPEANAEPAKPTEQAPGATNTDTKPAVDGNAEPAKPSTTAKLASSLPDTPATTATEPAKPAPSTWKDTLKAQGLDEKFIDLIDYYQKEGNVSKYLEATTTDYSKFSSEQIHRLNLQREYPEATPEELQALYETEVVEKYKLDPDAFSPDSKEAKAAKVKMELDAKKLQRRFTEDSQKLKLPTRDVAAEQAQAQATAEQQRQKDIDDFMGMDYSKSVMTDKKLTLKDLGPGIPDYHIELDKPEVLRDILFKPGEYARYSRDKDGNPDPVAQLQIAAFASNRVGFMQNLINYGKSLGKEEYVQEKYNPPPPKGAVGAPSNETLIEAFAARGKTGKGG